MAQLSWTLGVLVSEPVWDRNFFLCPGHDSSDLLERKCACWKALVKTKWYLFPKKVTGFCKLSYNFLVSKINSKIRRANCFFSDLQVLFSSFSIDHFPEEFTFGRGSGQSLSSRGWARLVARLNVSTHWSFPKMFNNHPPLDLMLFNFLLWNPIKMICFMYFFICICFLKGMGWRL